MLPLLLAGVLVFLAADTAFRLLISWLPKRVPALDLHDSNGHLRHDRLAAAALIHGVWDIGSGGLVLMVIWNASIFTARQISYGEAAAALVLGAGLALVLLFALELLLFGIGRPDLAALINAGPLRAGDVLPRPPSLEPRLVAAAGGVRSGLRPLEGDPGDVIRSVYFLDAWLNLEVASIALQRELGRQTLLRKLLRPTSLELAALAKARLDILKSAAIPVGAFSDEAVAAAAARRAARLSKLRTRQSPG